MVRSYSFLLDCAIESHLSLNGHTKGALFFTGLLIIANYHPFSIGPLLQVRRFRLLTLRSIILRSLVHHQKITLMTI